MNKTFTPGSRFEYVNKERGGGSGCDASIYPIQDESVIDIDRKILDELRQFRLEMESRMDIQKKDYASLESRFSKTETELRELKNILKVVQQKADKVDELQKQNDDFRNRNKQLEDGLTTVTPVCCTPQVPEEPKKSFATVAAKQTTSNTKKVVATKQANSPQVNVARKSRNSTSECETQNKVEKEDNWTVVKKKQRKYPNTEVKRGNASFVDIQGTEKKKFLHVWRLKLQTTIESLEKHVKAILGEDISVKINKIHHKTERDYTSFIIGVPESLYDKLCHEDNWDTKIEFCEWIWFRQSSNKPQ